MKGLGAKQSPHDDRTLSYKPSGAKQKGGKRYEPKDIRDQHKVGICTAISLTQHAEKVTGTEYSPEFQYLMQETLYEHGFEEGSSVFTALKVGKNVGLLPIEYWTYTTEKDRKLPYDAYIQKLRAVPAEDIEALKKLASQHKIKAYAEIPVDRDLLAQAIDESPAGIIARFRVGNEWGRAPIEPLRPPKIFISGHAIIISNYDGNSFRVANTWGTDWCDKGTAYFLLDQYAPTEAWQVYYNELPKHVEEDLEKIENLKKKMSILQKLLELTKKLNLLKNQK